MLQVKYSPDWKANARGVDLNANFDAAWEELEVKDRPSHSTNLIYDFVFDELWYG